MVVTGLVYLPVARFDFVNIDDGLYVTFNPLVQSGLGLKVVGRAFTTLVAGNWQPLTIISHQLDVTLFRLAPGPHHLHNLLLHLANSTLLFFIVLRLSGARWRSAFVAAVFALHPLHVESVAWISERKDLLSTLFALAALGTYGAYARRPDWRRLTMVAVLATLGLLAKPMLVTLPFLMLLLDFWPLGRWSMRQHISGARPGSLLIAEKAVLFALTVVFSTIAFVAQSRFESVQTLSKYPLAIRLGNAAISTVTYLRQTVWPVDLAIFYPHPGSGLSVLQVTLSAVVLAAISALAFRLRRTQPFVAVGWLWYLVMLVPVLGIVQLGELAHADRYTYLPLTGVLISAAWWLNQSAQGRPRAKALVSALGIGVIVALAVMCRFQVRTWKNNESLFTRALAVTSNNFIAHYNLGLVRAAQGRSAEAARHYTEAIRLQPYHGQAYFGLGTLAFESGAYADAAVQFGVAAKLDPGAVEPAYYLAISLERLRRFSEAESAFRDVLRLEPGMLDALLGLGRVLMNSGRLQDALEAFRAARRVDARSAEANSWVRLLDRTAQRGGPRNPPVPTGP
ncbi:MAG TPA: tetratricopeptide repeat protein [Candidatus Methanoperedens sp.]|nr:tetratricopeptide repeat protein [Candidatus Methanoperedens sp.]